LSIAAIDRQITSRPLVNITTDSLLVKEGVSYTFKKQKGYPKALYSNDKGSYYRLENDIGNLYISKFDPINRILSGTFFFVGTNSRGEKVNITDGRFDVRY
jgi:hypothetical protein